MNMLVADGSPLERSTLKSVACTVCKVQNWKNVYLTQHGITTGLFFLVMLGLFFFFRKKGIILKI